MSDSATDPEAVVDEQLRAYTDRDIEAFLDCYADDAVVTSLTTGEVVADGKAALRERYGALFEESPDLDCEIGDRIVHGQFVVDREELSGFRGEETEVVAISRVEDGLMQEVWLLQ